MVIAAHNPGNALKQRVRTPSLVIIEFVLDQLPHTGTAGQLLYLSLVQNYMMAPHKFHHQLIFFDANDAKQLKKHAAKVSKILKKFQKQ